MSGGTGRSKCRADGCQALVVAKVMLTPPVENEKVPFIGLCAKHASAWVLYLEDGFPAGFGLKPHKASA